MSSTPSNREVRTARTRDRIFKAAVELFAERGPADVTVEQITERAGVAKGTFFNHFTSKEALMSHFGGTQVERLQEAVAGGEINGTPAEQIHKALQVLATHPSLTPNLARVLFVWCLSHADPDKTEGPNVRHLQQVLAGIIRRGQEAGAFRTDRPADEAGLFILGQFILALLAWCSGYSEHSLPETVDRYATLGLEGLLHSG